MKILITYILCGLFLVACSSMELPTTEQSDTKIKQFTPEIDKANDYINAIMAKAVPTTKDINANIKLATLNKIANKLAYSKNDDIKIFFAKTNPIFSEHKSVLGINYNNYVNIDTGYVAMNLKYFNFDNFNNNRLDATIEIEGKGNIYVNGKYTGVPASVSPEIYLYLKESIQFDITPTDTGYIVLKPVPKQLTLKTKFSVKLLQWDLPWNQSVNLQLTDLIKSMPISIAFNSELTLPKPSAQFGGEQFTLEPYLIDFKNSSINSANKSIEFKSFFQIKPKK